MHINKNFIDKNSDNIKVAIISIIIAGIISFIAGSILGHAGGISLSESFTTALIASSFMTTLLHSILLISLIFDFNEPVFIKKILSEDGKVYTIESVEFHEKIIASAPSLSLTHELNNILSDSNVKVKFTGIKKEYEMPYSEYLGLDGKAIIKTQTILNLWDKEKVITLSSPEKVS